jgi:outer membrane protein insertion porin family
MKQLWPIKKGKEGLEKLLKQKYRYFTGVIAFLLLLPLLGSNAFGQFKVGLGSNNNSANPQKDEDKIALSYANPREFEIADIEVTGLETIDKNALISLSGLKVGDKVRIPSQTTSNAIKKLWNRGIIGNVALYISKVEGDKAYLVLELTERPRLT